MFKENFHIIYSQNYEYFLALFKVKYRCTSKIVA